jgi:transposase
LSALPTKPDLKESPRVQARTLLGLLESHSVESVRQIIGTTPERLPILREFDLLTLHLPRHPERMRGRLRVRCNGTALSPFLRALVIACLRAGWTQERILEKYPVGPGVVLRLSKEIGASYLKPRGRGRRLSAELKQTILAAVQAKRRAADLQREFQIDYDTVQAFRYSIGDTEDRRHWQKLSREQIEQAVSMLRAGEKWLAVASELGVSLATLQKHVAYRKRAGEGWENEQVTYA